jgi:molybdenum cofactor biosynthesis enzyme MoaA
MNPLIEKALQQFRFSKKKPVVEFAEQGNIFKLYDLSRSVPASSPPCLAPWTSVSFSIDGYANVCCLNKKTSVNVEEHSISEILNSESFNLLRENVAANNLSYDCAICSEQIQAKNFSGVKAAGYDAYYPYDPKYPRVMEFCLENTCNLACTMCNSVLSSTIRKNQNLPPLKKNYSDDFINEIDNYIPHLQEAIFSGGEPFLIPTYFKIWDKMLALNPNIKISVVTNGTTLNERIKDLMERGRFNINISIDSVHKETYEAVRVNAKFENVMQNFEWFSNYGKRKNLPVNIPVCPLTVNWQGIPDVVRFTNNHNVSLNFVYVERPESLSLVHRSPDYLDKVLELYKNQEFDTSTEFAKNNTIRFAELIGFIEKWRSNNLVQVIDNASETLMVSWEEKILNSNIPQTEENPNARQEMVLKIKSAINEVAEQQRPAVINLLNKFSDDRFYNFIKEKSPREIAVVFTEFAGK